MNCYVVEHPYNGILLINMMNEPQKHGVTTYCMVLLMYTLLVCV